MTPLSAIATTPANAASETNASAPSSAPDPRIVKAARDFEAIFVRHMLKSLEKTTSVGSGHSAAGSGTYGSMVVNAMAEAVSGAGGLGLSDVLVKSMSVSHPGVGRPAASLPEVTAEPGKPLK
jgi:flagellar protein FlgJ